MDRPFAQRLTRLPVPHDPEAGAQVQGAFAGMPADLAALLAGAAGGSPHLAGLVLREAGWLRDALDRPPEAALAQAMAALAPAPSETLRATLRQAKRRIGLLVALADLGGVWPLETVTGALTALADRAADLGLRALVAEERARGRLADPGPDAGGMVILAMGKMGARELNYSSDIDLVCLYDDAAHGAGAAEARPALVRITRRLMALLSDITADGYVFRTDLRLRPDAAVTPVCLSVSAAEAYYESEGRTWERAAFIKARPCAGDLDAGRRFLSSLAPFVWRRHLDFAAIQDAHDMRLRIREHRGLRGIGALEGHDLKLGAGGIREIEFFTQTRQLIAGGRDPSLRDPTTVGGLAALARAGWVPAATAETLAADYRALREVEHRVQMVNDAQTHALPATPEGLARIAHLSGWTDVAAFRAALLDRLVRTDRLTEGFFAPDAQADAGPALSETARAVVERWPAYPALRSERARATFRRLRPTLLRRLTEGGGGDEALVSFDGFLAGLPAGAQLFALFEANPPLVDLIADIASTTPALARYLARNAGVLDAVIGGGFFAPWPGAAGLARGLAEEIGRAAGYEAMLDAARRWMKDWHFRVGVHHLRGLVGADEAGRQYADLARAVLTALWPAVLDEVAGRHGPPPGRGAAVVGLGSLGAGHLNAASDLDLIVIYDAAGVAASAGPRPLAARAWYARATQALATALSAPTAGGRLYEVDMRLRPSGRQGPVATSLAAFEAYHRDEAWTWEHLALTRARVVAGPPDLGAEVEAVRRRVLAAKAGGPGIARDVADMRARLLAARGAPAPLEPRHGPGRLMDVELAAQMAALRAASPARTLGAQLAAAGSPPADRAALLRAERLFRSMRTALRLLGTPEPEQIAAGGRAFLLRETGAASMDHLAALAAAAAADAAAVVDRWIERGIDGDAP